MTSERRVDRHRETTADRRFKVRRESGSRAPIDQDGSAVTGLRFTTSDGRTVFVTLPATADGGVA